MKFKRKILTAALLLSMITPALADQSYEIDQSHASIGFTIDHLVISKVRGEFRDFQGTLVLDDAGALKETSALVSVASIDTGIDNRDNHLRSPDFFNAEQYLDMTFKSKEVTQAGENHVLVGDLTIHGVTREVSLPFQIKGPVTGPMGETRIGFEAATVINRADYGLTWNKTLETGGIVVGEEVNIIINFEAIQN